MKDIFRRLNTLVSMLTKAGYKVSDYTKQDIENERTDREIIILSDKRYSLKFEDGFLNLHTNYSNIEIDNEYIVDINYLNNIKNDFNKSNNTKEYK